jgi:hypothetical protein
MPRLVARRPACRVLVVSVAASESHHATREPRHEFGEASTASAQPGDPVGRAQRQPKPCSLGPPRGSDRVPGLLDARAVLRRATARRGARAPPAAPTGSVNLRKNRKPSRGPPCLFIYAYARTENFGPARYRSYDDVARRRWGRARCLPVLRMAALAAGASGSGRWVGKQSSPCHEGRGVGTPGPMKRAEARLRKVMVMRVSRGQYAATLSPKSAVIASLRRVGHAEPDAPAPAGASECRVRTQLAIGVITIGAANMASRS